MLSAYLFFHHKKYFMKQTHSSFKRILLVLAFCMAAFSFSASAQDKSATVSGEVVDMNCYMASEAKGDGHKSCALGCIKNGGPMGVLTSDGKLYLLLEDHSKKDAYAEAKKHAGEQITVTGTLAEKDGIKSISVSEVKANG